MVTSEDRVERDLLYTGHPVMERCSVVSRIAPSFLRFGSFEICKASDPTTGARLRSSLWMHFVAVCEKLVSWVLEKEWCMLLFMRWCMLCSRARCCVSLVHLSITQVMHDFVFCWSTVLRAVLTRQYLSMIYAVVWHCCSVRSPHSPGFHTAAVPVRTFSVPCIKPNTGLCSAGRGGPSHGLEVELLPRMLDHTIRSYFPDIWRAHLGDTLRACPTLVIDAHTQ